MGIIYLFLDFMLHISTILPLLFNSFHFNVIVKSCHWINQF